MPASQRNTPYVSREIEIFRIIKTTAFEQRDKRITVAAFRDC